MGRTHGVVRTKSNLRKPARRADGRDEPLELITAQADLHLVLAAWICGAAWVQRPCSPVVHHRRRRIRRARSRKRWNVELIDPWRWQIRREARVRWSAMIHHLRRESTHVGRRTTAEVVAAVFVVGRSTVALVVAKIWSGRWRRKAFVAGGWERQVANAGRAVMLAGKG